ncbi:MAG: 6-hydroxycyclohex-1-ene-1-carbonyl-CoA dehydrogenase [Calditrichae bacterium]|nr:6-hydroxycyclohex-1-ene-1-carbonyl-CoA dehydrogenase [Calditrichia bacterium]
MINPKEPFELMEKSFAALEKGEVLVKVAGCGVCHTDLSFWYFGVKTRHELPLALGHEISGTVIDGEPEWIGNHVIVPAVLPCGECTMCKKGRSNICRNQLMPGNDFDGGFASHVKVPAKFLCPVPDGVLSKYPLEQLSVVADAVSTPYQVMEKSELEAGDLAIAIGVGGIGTYGAQISKIKGAKVLALDISDEKLTMIKDAGIDATLNVKNMDAKSLKANVKEIAKELGASSAGWKVFEMSGTKTGQELAFNLLSFGGTLSVVGFTMDKVEVRLSNLMAFDAKAIGTWGCKAELYPEIVRLIGERKIKIEPFIETFPMSKINEVFQNSLEHKYSKRPILTPDFD